MTYMHVSVTSELSPIKTEQESQEVYDTSESVEIT